MNKMTLYLHQ